MTLPPCHVTLPSATGLTQPQNLSDALFMVIYYIPNNNLARRMTIFVLLVSSKVHDVRMMTQCGCVPQIFELSRDLELEHEIFCEVY